MVVAFYLEDMSDNPSGKFFSGIVEFAITTFKVSVSKDGYITVDGCIASISYTIGNSVNAYTEEEALEHFAQSGWFKAYAKSKFWTVYKAVKLI